MSTSENQKREYPSTYFVQNRAAQDEIPRLQMQDRMLTTGMGGVLAEQSDPGHFQRVLDIACGTGGWLVEVAKNYPEITELVGVDINSKMVEYARQQADAQQVGERVKFRTMDIMMMIGLADTSFDLINGRYCASFLRIMDWPKVLYALRGLLKTDGVIRLTECDIAVESNSPALTQLGQMFIQAFYQAGHLPSSESVGMANEIEGMLKRHEFENIQSRRHLIQYQGGTASGEALFNNGKYLFRMVEPFIRKWIRITDEYEAIYQRALYEMQQPDFTASWRLVTAWGSKPAKKRHKPGKSSLSSKLPSKQPSTYFVQDRSNQDEISRLKIQDQLITGVMGGLLPEQTAPESFQYVLDVGCGTGGWLIETAKTYPTMSYLVGVDISSKMIEYARQQTIAEQISARVQFCVGDVLRRLEFPDDTFDLVNQRLGRSYLRVIDWPKLLSEYQRVTRPGGVIRITESDVPVNSSPALTQLNTLFLKAFYQAGHSTSPDDSTLLDDLSKRLKQSGIQNVQTRTHVITYHAGTVKGEHFAEDMGHLYQTLQPYLRKWIQVPKDYETIYQQALKEMREPGFSATWSYFTVWGTTPL